MEIQFQTIAADYYRLQNQRGGSWFYPNYSHVRLESGELNTISSEVTPVDTFHKMAIYGGDEPSLKTEQNLENFEKIRLVDGTCSDLGKRSITIIKPDESGVVKIRLDQDDDQVLKNNTLGVTLFSSDLGAKAVSSTHKGEISRYVFTQKVYPRGKIMLDSDGASVKTQAVIGLLKTRGYPSVAGFFNDGEQYYWIVEGIFTKKTSKAHTHKWSS